jgi:YVTN family beta-propeller protein
MMQNQFGESAAPASPTRVEEEANVGTATEEDVLKQSIKKLQQVYGKTMATAVAVASIIQSKAAQWEARVGVLVAREVRNEKITLQIREWFAQVNQAVERVKNRSQSMEADFVSLAGANLIEVEDLIEAITGGGKIVRRIDYCQAEMEVKQADILTTCRTLEIVAEQLKRAYLQWMETVVVVAKIARREAKKWVAKAEEMRLEYVEEEMVAQTQVQVQKWLTQMKRIWRVVEEMLEQSYTSSDMVAFIKVAPVVVRDAVKVIVEAEKIVAHVQICQARIVSVKMARVARQAEEAAREMEAKKIEAEIRKKIEKKEKAAKETREEAAVERAKFKEEVKTAAKATKEETKAVAVNDASRVTAAEATEEIRAKKSAERQARVAVAYVVNPDSNSVSAIDTVAHRVLATIPVKGKPKKVEFTPDRTQAYVLVNRDHDDVDGVDNVIVINTTTQQVSATIPVKGTPEQVKFTSDGNWAYVCVFVNRDNKDVHDMDHIIVIDTTIQQMSATIPVGKEPVYIAFAPDGTRVYVANRGSDDISVIDTVIHRVLATISVGKEPTCVALAPDGTKGYVANRGSDDISVIDTAIHRVLVTIPMKERPIYVALSPDGTKVYVVNYANGMGNVSVIDTFTDCVLAIISVKSPHFVAFTRDRTKGYVLSGRDQVSVIDTVAQRVLTTLKIGEGSLQAACLTPDETQFYVISSRGVIHVIDTAINRVLSTIPVSVKGHIEKKHVAFTPDGNWAYVVDELSGDISVIDTVMRQVSTVISVGKCSRALAIAPIAAKEAV